MDKRVSGAIIPILYGAVGGIMLLHESAGIRTVIGFAFMLCGMPVSRWELIGRRN